MPHTVDKIRLQIDLALVDLDEYPGAGPDLRRGLLVPAEALPVAERSRPTLLAPERAASMRLRLRHPSGS